MIYNQQMELVEKLEDEGKIFVIRPLIPTVSRLEKNYDALMHFYEHGYRLMKRQYQALQEYMGKIGKDRKRRIRMRKPRIAVPIGDPAGIGPEIVAKAMASNEISDVAECITVGDKRIMERAVRFAEVETLKIRSVTNPEEGDYRPGVMNLIDLSNLGSNEYEMGAVNGKCGRAAYEYIEKSVKLALDGRVDAVATTPINKESLKAGGINYIGHTEIFGALTETKDPLTMFETRGLRIFFLTRHVSLREMLEMIKKERIIEYVKRCTKALKQLGVENGTMAVAGLNPHSGEHGLFGWEEEEEIVPAIEELKAEGYDVEGPCRG